MKAKTLTHLFYSFFKIGLIAFGGGYVVIPLLQREAVETRRWISQEELTDIMAVSQAMPGIIFVNSATVIGYRIAGFWGAVTATCAGVLPTFIITLLTTIFLWKYINHPLINKAFTGILLGVTALIIYSITKMWPQIIKTGFDLFMAVAATIALLVFKLNVVWIIITAALLGFGFNLILKAKGEI